MTVQIGLLLLMRYDDTVKIEPTRNDAVMPHSTLPFLSRILLLQKKYDIKNGLTVKLICILDLVVVKVEVIT